MKTHIFFLGIVSIVAGCATSSDIADSDMKAGISKSYAAPISQIRRLTLESIKGLNVDVTGVREQEAGYVISFSKPTSAFSWGEVGRVVVSGNNSSSTVIVLSEKRMRIQVSGTSNKEFADAVFDGISYALAKK